MSALAGGKRGLWTFTKPLVPQNLREQAVLKNKRNAFPRGSTAFVTTPVSHEVASWRRLLWGTINILSHSEQCCPNVLDGVRSSDSHVGSREVDAIIEILNSKVRKQKENRGRQGLNYSKAAKDRPLTAWHGGACL